MALSAGGKALYNVTILGVAFLLVFTAFQTCGMIQTVVLRDDVDFHGSGYDSLAIIYAVFAAANWIAPSVVALLGARWSMLASAVVYTGFIASFLHPIAGVLYSLSALLGLAAAVIWTAQGNYLTENSNEQTMGRNSGLFWAMLQCSLLFGNLFFFLELEGKTSITSHLRTIIFIVLTVISGIGVLTFLFLTKPPEEFTSLSVQQEEQTTGFFKKAVTAFDTKSESLEMKAGISGSCIVDAQDQGETLLYHQQRYHTQNTQLESKPFKCKVRSAKLMLKKEMLIISITNFYTGLELTFFSGVYGTAISNTKLFGVDSNSFIGISGMLIGAGEITGGLLFGILGKKTIKFGRDPIILLGYVVHMVCFYLIFLNLPAESPIQSSHEGAYIGPYIELAFACSFMLGFADACFNTQIYSLLGSYFKSDSASAFALFKFIQSAAAAIAFAYSLVLLLHWQLLILVVCGSLGALSFFYVEHHPPRNEI